MKVTFYFSLYLLATVASFANAKLYPTSEIFELVLFGDGYDDAMEDAAWNTVTSIFDGCYGTGFKVLEIGGKRRLLRGAGEEESEEDEAAVDIEQEQQQRELLSTCPASCKGKTTRKCRYLCGSGGGRRLQKNQVNFNKSKCESKMNTALANKYIKKNKGVTMRATINV